MRLSSLAALMILATIVLSACAQEQVATLEDHSTQLFVRSGPVPLGKPFAMAQPANTYNTLATQPTVSVASYDTVSSNDLPAPTIHNVSTPHVPQAVVAKTPIVIPAPAPVVTSWQWPLDGRIIEGYGKQGNGIANEGITIAAKKGTPIHAAATGEVVFVGNQLKDYGNMVILRHSGGEMSAYSHAAEVIVAKGDHVKQGDVLGYVGQSGNAPQPELHFAVRAGDHAIDPASVLPRQTASIE